MHIFVWVSSGFFSLLFTKLVILYVYGQCLLILSCETIWIGLSTPSDIIHVNGAARFRHHLTQNSRIIVPSASPIDIYSPSLHQPGFRWKNKNWRDTLCSLDNSIHSGVFHFGYARCALFIRHVDVQVIIDWPTLS